MTLTKCDLTLYLWSSYNCLTLPHLLISLLPPPPTPFLTVSVSSLRLRRVQTVLHRGLKNQRTANPRSESSPFHFHLKRHWHKKINTSIKIIIFSLIYDRDLVFEEWRLCLSKGLPKNQLRNENDSFDMKEPFKELWFWFLRCHNVFRLHILTCRNHTKRDLW